MEHFLKFLQAGAVLTACLIAIYFQLHKIYENLPEDPEEGTFPDNEVHDDYWSQVQEHQLLKTKWKWNNKED